MNTLIRDFEFGYRRRSDRRFFEVFHAHPQMEFTYVHEGTGNLIVEGKRYAVEPNTLMIFQPFQLHRIQVDVAPDLPFIRTVIMFDPALLKAYWPSFPHLESFFERLLKRSDGNPLCGIGEAETLVVLLKSFNEALAGLSAHESKEETHFFLLNFLRQLKPLWQQRHENSADDTRKHRHRAEEIMQWIEEHYPEPFKLEQMARDLHLSAFHLAHLFKQATGSTIVDYTRATRIRHASVLLNRTSLTVPEIGTRVGIPDPSYFCKVFREKMGSTPHQYRLYIQKRK